jgi:arylsulfatase A-like enzyme
VDKVRVSLSGYYAMIENLDWNVGRIRRALDRTGLSVETHLCFFSDHGDMHGSHGRSKKQVPFRESIRIPFIIGGEQFYGRKKGKDITPINHVDIAPTTLGLCGIDKPDWMEGTDYSGHRLNNRQSVKEPDSAFIQNVSGGGDLAKPWRGIVTKDGWKYACFEREEWLLFNLLEDPYEQMNLAHSKSHRPKSKQLNERLRQWIEQTGDQFSLPVY